MLSPIMNTCSVSPQMQAVQMDNNFSPLKGRACCNWQSTFLLINLVTLVAGVFFTFSISFPILALGLTALGVLEVIVYHCATKNDADIPTISEYSSLKKAYTIAQEKIQEGLGKKEREDLEKEKRALELRLQETQGPLQELAQLQLKIKPQEEYEELMQNLPELRRENEALTYQVPQRNQELINLKKEYEKSAQVAKKLARGLQTKKEEIGRAEQTIQEYALRAQRLKSEIEELEKKKNGLEQKD